ncbi:MAG: DUF2177 family protein [Pseudomonadota bacterium]
MTWARAYLGALVAFLAIDSVWLGFIAAEFYRERIGHLMLAEPNFAAAAAFYLMYLAGIVYLAVAPAVRAGNWRTALARGAALGFVAYGTYDFTNYATLTGWPLDMVLIDLVWGTFLTGTAAVASYFAAGRPA